MSVNSNPKNIDNIITTEKKSKMDVDRSSKESNKLNRSDEFEIREIKEDKKSISEWLGEPEEKERRSFETKQDFNFESKEIGFFTSRKRERDPDSITTRSNRQERPKSRDNLYLQYSSEPVGRQISYERVKERMKEEGLLYEYVQKESKYPSINGNNFMMGLDQSDLLDLDNLISSKVKKLTNDILTKELSKLKSGISELLESSIKSNFEIPIEIPITHTYPQQTQIKNNILRDLKIELNFFKEKMKKDITKSMETRIKYIDLASSNRYDLFNDKIKKMEENIKRLKNEIRELKTKENSDIENLGWNVSCITKSTPFTPNNDMRVKKKYVKRNYNSFYEMENKENNIRISNMDHCSNSRSKSFVEHSKNVEFGAKNELKEITRSGKLVEKEEKNNISDKKFGEVFLKKNQKNSKSVNHMFKSPQIVNNGYSFSKFLARNRYDQKPEEGGEMFTNRSKSTENFRENLLKLNQSARGIYQNINKLKIQSKPTRANFFNFHEEENQEIEEEINQNSSPEVENRKAKKEKEFPEITVNMMKLVKEEGKEIPEISPRILTPPRPTVNSSYENSECMGLSIIKEEEEAHNSGKSSFNNSSKNSKLVSNYTSNLSKNSRKGSRKVSEILEQCKVNIRKSFYCDEKTSSKKEKIPSTGKKSVTKRERRKSVMRSDASKIDIKLTPPNIKKKEDGIIKSPLNRKISKKIEFENVKNNLTLENSYLNNSKYDESLRYTGPEITPTDIDTDFTRQILRTSSSRKISKELGSSNLINKSSPKEKFL